MFLIIFLQVFTLLNIDGTLTQSSKLCDSPIYCSGKLLDSIQMARIFPDSKTFVDLAMITDPESIISSFEKLLKINNHLRIEDLESFVKENFLKAHETKPWILNNFKSNLKVIENITDNKMRYYAEDVIRSFSKLGRIISEDVKKNPEKYSTISLPNGFIVSEKNNEEISYFESFWIIQSLLSLEEFEIAKGMLDNLIFMVKQFGYIPLANRVYYLNRTHPPLLTKTARMYYEKTKDITWIKQNIQYLDDELKFWLNNLITIYVDSVDYILAVYPSGGYGPRPEYYFEDVQTAAIFKNDTDKEKLYEELRRASQTGWELPSRWIFNDSITDKSLTTISRVIPVDLNAILYGAFNDLSNLYRILGLRTAEIQWKTYAVIFKDAITNVFYDDVDGVWYDYDLKLKIKIKKFFVSCLTPLWTKAYPRSSDQQKHIYGEKVVKFLNKITKSSLFDFKSVPAPYQSIIIDGLKETLNEEAIKLAGDLAKSWILNIQRTYNDNLGNREQFKLQRGNELKNAVVLDYVIKNFLTERKQLSSSSKTFLKSYIIYACSVFIFLVFFFK